MPTPQQGVVSLRVNGGVIRLKSHVTWSPGGKVGKKVEGPVELVGIANTFMAPMMQVESTDGADVSIADLQAIRDTTVTCQLESGKTLVLQGASVVEQIEVNTEEGGFTLQFVGQTLKEI